MYPRTYFHNLLMVIFMCIVSLLCVKCQVYNDDVLVDMPAYGQVLGFSIHTQNPETWDKRTNIFLGIPYAKGPKDFDDPNMQFRFQKPDPTPQWRGILNAREWPPACPQMTWFARQTIPGFSRMSEDCLYINVFAPNDTRDSNPPSCTHRGSSLHPVMVFIHGGGYIMGTAQQWPPIMLAERNVVVVTFNFRLGALGFLSTGTEDSVGNYGMWDQVAALEFIQDNIQCFGGDPGKITLFGQSSGAASVGLHILAPSTRRISSISNQLFHQAIMMSGCDRSEWALIRETQHAKEYAQQLAKLLGCPSNDNYQMIRCLRLNRNAEEIANASARVQLNKGHFGSPWGPVIDGRIEGSHQSFLPRDPKALRNSLQYPSMRVMAGLVKDEGSWFIPNLPTLPQGITNTQFENIIREFLKDRGASNVVESIEAMKFQYTYWPAPRDMDFKRQMLTDMMSDYMFGTSLNEVLQHNSIKNLTGTFGYIFNYKSYNDYMPSWRGIAHGQDLQYVFGFPYFNETYQKLFGVTPRQSYTFGDNETSNFMMSIVTSFATHGDPTSYSYYKDQEFANVTWRTFNVDKDKERNSMLVIANGTRSHMIDSYRQQYYGFWREYITRKMGLRHSQTAAETAPTLADPENEFKIATYCLIAALVLLIIIVLTVIIMYCTHKKTLKNESLSSTTLQSSRAGTLGELRLNGSAASSREYEL